MNATTMPRLRTIRLYGKLGARFGRVWHLAVNSPAEAVRALSVLLPGFEKYMMGSKDHGVGYGVFLGKRNLSQEQLDTPPGNEDIRIAPVILGAKSGGWITIILGVALIAVAAFMTGGLSLALFASGGLWGGVAVFGAAMVIAGAAQLLAPSPTGGPQDTAENTPSYAFSGPVNTQAQGNPVPLLYGKLHIGSSVASAGIVADDEVYIPEPPPGGGGGGGGSAGGSGGGGSPPWHLDWVNIQ